MRHEPYLAGSWEHDICPVCTDNDMSRPVFWPCPVEVRERTLDEAAEAVVALAGDPATGNPSKAAAIAAIAALRQATP